MGQVLLTLGSIILLGTITLGINSMYLLSVEESVSSQITADAINYGRDQSERLNSYTMKYHELDADWGHLNDENDPDKRLQFTSQIGITYLATVELTGEVPVASGQVGRIATITVFNQTSNGPEQLLQYIASITNLTD